MPHQRILVSARGKNDAIEAVAGGAHIIDAEYPGSALGTPYPLNIYTIRRHVPSDRLVATNIGEKQFVWATASQAALGVAIAGADIIKVGLAELRPREASEVMNRVIRNVTRWATEKRFIATFFADDELKSILDPVLESQKVGIASGANGILIDTFFKDRGKGLLDYLTLDDIKRFVNQCHKSNLEAWVAGSIVKEHMRDLWIAGVDVICIRRAAIDDEVTDDRMGKVSRIKVKELIETIP